MKILEKLYTLGFVSSKMLLLIHVLINFSCFRANSDLSLIIKSTVFVLKSAFNCKYHFNNLKPLHAVQVTLPRPLQDEQDFLFEP